MHSGTNHLSPPPRWRRYAGRWSKTMVGFHSEDTNFALELTANYGVESYELGNDLRCVRVLAWRTGARLVYQSAMP